MVVGKRSLSYRGPVTFQGRTAKLREGMPAIPKWRYGPLTNGLKHLQLGLKPRKVRPTFECHIPDSMSPQCDRFIPDHWRSPKPLEGLLKYPKKVTKTIQVYKYINIIYIYILQSQYKYQINLISSHAIFASTGYHILDMLDNIPSRGYIPSQNQNWVPW